MTAPRCAIRWFRVASLRRLCIGFGLACAALWMGVTHAQLAASEVEIKAAFIYNFALFTTWPAQALLAGAPMVVCVAPGHPLQEALGKLAGKSVRGHRLEVRRINDGAADGCNVVVYGDHSQTAPMHIDPFAPVLTVADGHQASRAGSAGAAMIALALQDNRVVFDVDAGAAHRAGLQLSSQLLRLARSVQ